MRAFGKCLTVSAIAVIVSLGIYKVTEKAITSQLLCIRTVVKIDPCGEPYFDCGAVVETVKETVCKKVPLVAAVMVSD